MLKSLTNNAIQSMIGDASIDKDIVGTMLKHLQDFRNQ